MHGAAIVEHQHVAASPFVTERVFRPDRLFKQVLQKWTDFLSVHADNAARLGDVEIERLSAGFGVRAYHGLRDALVVFCPILIGIDGIVCFHVVYGLHAVNRSARCVIEVLKAVIHVGKTGVASLGR